MFSWLPSSSSSERPCLTYRNCHFIGNSIWSDPIEMLQDKFLLIVTSTDNLPVHCYFKSKEAKSLRWICHPPSVSIRRISSRGLDGGFLVTARTLQKDQTQTAPTDHEQVLRKATLSQGQMGGRLHSHCCYFFPMCNCFHSMKSTSECFITRGAPSMESQANSNGILCVFVTNSHHLLHK